MRLKTIALNTILKWFDSKQIEYQFVNPNSLNGNFTAASLFEPIKGGFYFFLGTSLPIEIKNSLILVTESFDCSDSNNAYLSISKDPQMVYYKILGEFFGTSSNGQISPTALIHPDAKIGKNVQIDHFCIIGNCEIGDNTKIASHCILHDNTVVGEEVTIECHSVIGTTGVAWTWNEDQTEKIVQPQLGGVHIGDYCFLAAQTIIVRGSLSESTKIGKNCLLAPGSRIGHGTKIGNYVHFANSIITGGNTVIGDYCFVGSAAVFRPKVKIHENTIVGAGTVVVKNTTRSGLTLMGVPAKETPTKANPSGMPKPKSNN